MLININRLSKEIGMSQSTLRRWEREGKLTSIRTDGGHRRYELETVLRVMKGMKMEEIGKTCCYARVSTKGQKEDLKRQKQVLELFCAAKGFQHFLIEDFGSGLNYKKKGLVELMDLIIGSKIQRLVLTHRDRLVRFGSELIFNLCKLNGIEVVIISGEDEELDNNKEFVNDVLEIITHFSSKLYGSRSHKNKAIIEQNKKLFSEE